MAPGDEDEKWRRETETGNCKEMRGRDIANRNGKKK